MFSIFKQIRNDFLTDRSNQSVGQKLNGCVLNVDRLKYNPKMNAGIMECMMPIVEHYRLTHFFSKFELIR
jgi:hypothetical protein